MFFAAIGQCNGDHMHEWEGIRSSQIELVHLESLNSRHGFGRNMHATRQVDHTADWSDVDKAGLGETKHITESPLVYSSYNIHSPRPDCFFESQDNHSFTKLQNLVAFHYSLVCHQISREVTRPYHASSKCRSGSRRPQSLCALSADCNE